MELRAALDRRAEIEAAYQKIQASQTETLASLARFERRAELLEKERDGLKRVLASFTEEEAATTIPNR